MQICPDCQYEWQDSANYCSSCLAKLPNADETLPDYKKFYGTSSVSHEKKLPLLWECMEDETFRNQLLRKLLVFAVKSVKSSPQICKPAGDDILVIAVTEAMAYAEERNTKKKDENGKKLSNRRSVPAKQ